MRLLAILLLTVPLYAQSLEPEGLTMQEYAEIQAEGQEAAKHFMKTRSFLEMQRKNTEFIISASKCVEMLIR